MITVTIGKIFELIYNILSEVMKFIYNGFGEAMDSIWNADLLAVLSDTTYAIVGLSIPLGILYIIGLILKRNDK